MVRLKAPDTSSEIEIQGVGQIELEDFAERLEHEPKITILPNGKKAKVLKFVLGMVTIKAVSEPLD